MYMICICERYLALFRASVTPCWCQVVAVGVKQPNSENCVFPKIVCFQKLCVFRVCVESSRCKESCFSVFVFFVWANRELPAAAHGGPPACAPRRARAPRRTPRVHVKILALLPRRFCVLYLIRKISLHKFFQRERSILQAFAPNALRGAA